MGKFGEIVGTAVGKFGDAVVDCGARAKAGAEAWQWWFPWRWLFEKKLGSQTNRFFIKICINLIVSGAIGWGGAFVRSCDKKYFFYFTNIYSKSGLTIPRGTYCYLKGRP